MAKQNSDARSGCMQEDSLLIEIVLYGGEYRMAAMRPHIGHSVPLGHFPKADMRQRRVTFSQISPSRPRPLFAILDQTRLSMTPRLRGRSGQFAYLVQRRSPDSP